MRIFLEFKLQTAEWGEVPVSRILPTPDEPLWGRAAPLRDTPWGGGIQTVSGEDFSNALHGHVVPLVRSLGTPPAVRLRRIPEGWRTCDMSNGCISYKPENCHPCKDLPDCYVPPQVSSDALALATHVVLAWRDGFHVVVVKGGEFTL